MAANVQRTLYRGDTWVLNVEVHPPGQSFGPQNITGYFCWCTIKKNPGDPDSAALAQVTTASGNIVFTDPVQGTLQVTIPSATTLAIPINLATAYYDVQLSDLSANISHAESGVISILTDITQATQTSAPIAPLFGAQNEAFYFAATPTLLTTTNVASLLDGTIVYVSSLQAFFYLTRGSVSTPIDSINVFQATPSGLWVRFFPVLTVNGGTAVGGAPIVPTSNIANATNANPIVVTTATNHGLTNGQFYWIQGVLGNTAANGVWGVTVTDNTHFSIPPAGNGAYVANTGTVGPVQVSHLGTNLPGCYTQNIDLQGFDSSVYLTQNGTTWARMTADNTTFTGLNGNPANPSQGGGRYALIVTDPGSNVDFQLIGPRLLLESNRLHPIIQANATLASGERFLDVQANYISVDDSTNTTGVSFLGNGYLQCTPTGGAGFATTGFLRSQSAQTLAAARNNAGTADIVCLSTNSSDYVTLGDPNLSRVECTASSFVRLFVASTSVAYFSASEWHSYVPALNLAQGVTGAATVSFDQGNTSITFQQTQQANGANPVNMVFAPQAPGAGASTAATGTPGSFFINVAVPVSTGAEAGLLVERNSTPVFRATAIPGMGTGCNVTLGNLANDGAHYTLQSDGSGYTAFNVGISGGTGYFRVTNSTTFMFNQTGVQLGGTNTFSLGGGSGVVGVANAGTTPISNPTGGGILYASAGAGKWLGSSGTTTTFGPADLEGFDGHCPVCGTDFALEWSNERTGALTICMHCLAEELGDRKWIVKQAPK